MEYAALGIPAIVARTIAIESYFDDRMVQFFTPGDQIDLAHCISLLYSDRKRLQQLAENITTFNKTYNWKKLGAEYVELVLELADCQK
jgi:glycosyltransferase involved in cell wall biosynthesis